MGYYDKLCGVYLITCLVNNKHYVGGTIKFNQRKSVHKVALKAGKHSNHHLQKDYNLYGKENFEITLIDECTENILLSLEHYWCTILNTHSLEFGYNIMPTNPYQSNSGVADETKKLISKAHKGKTVSDEFRKGTSLRFRGKKQCSEWVEKRIRHHRGKKRSEETRQKMSANRPHKEILQYSIDKIFIKEWKSLNQIREELKINTSGISKCLTNKNNKISNGFLWRYKKEQEITV